MIGNGGGCCAKGASLDSQGACCSEPVDVCGVCGGNGTAIDFTGSCCSGDLDAGGLCCAPPASIDDFGVCGGSSHSGIVALGTTVEANSIQGKTRIVLLYMLTNKVLTVSALCMIQCVQEQAMLVI